MLESLAPMGRLLLEQTRPQMTGNMQATANAVGLQYQLHHAQCFLLSASAIVRLLALSWA